MKTLLKNLTVIPVTRDSLSFKADILISGSVIEEIGPGLVCPEADVVRDCTGLIALPGTMTGQILGGSSPSVAIKYQILLMIAIFASSLISVLLTLWISRRKSFDRYGMMRF